MDQELANAVKRRRDFIAASPARKFTKRNSAILGWITGLPKAI